MKSKSVNASAAIIAAVMLTALIVYTLVNSLMQYISDNATPATGLVKEAPAMERVQPVDLQEIAYWNLFGESSVAEQAASYLPAPVVETRLMLSLKGVYAPEDEATGWAIISEDQGDERNFMLGDEVSGGAVLAKIEPDKVLLERNGEMESLILEKESLPLTK
ncbi:MAG: type II secretion system protein N [Sedimenticola sp.]